LRQTTVGRTPLDEGPARRRDLYLTTHNTHKRQTSMPPVGYIYIYIFCLSGVFPLDPFLYCLNPFVLHVTLRSMLLSFTTNTTQTSMPPVGFEATIPASERPQTHALDRTATGIGLQCEYLDERCKEIKVHACN
jgi:hypothetical protein